MVVRGFSLPTRPDYDSSTASTVDDELEAALKAARDGGHWEVYNRVASVLADHRSEVL